ncbi:MAG: carbohydrate kinase [Tannerellaceae bacterium]|jgi:fructokinase|nr:carbohydrate kinase [Tannerellaceae bacterium]
MGKTVVGIGELLWDIFPDYRKAGGAPANFVYHASKLGAEGCFIGAVGNDILGKEILKELSDNQINGFIETVNFPTGTVKVELKDGQPTYTIVEGVAWDYIPLTDKAIDIIGHADAICYGTLAQRSRVSHATIAALLDYARPDALRFFDINLRQHYYSAMLIEETLHKSNVFKVNDDELATLRNLFSLEGSDDDICSRFITKYNLQYMILTAGSISSTVYTDDDKSFIPTPQVKVVDTVGAGDAFSGAFLCSILSGRSFREAHSQAVETSAYVCTRPGAWCDYSDSIVARN